MSLLITNIQRFSLQDGPGTRTTIFLKGCSLKCPWCCNPENINNTQEFYYQKSKCISCDKCVNICDVNRIVKPSDLIKIKGESECFNCRKCIEICPTQAIGIYGEKLTVEELVYQIKKDKKYFDASNGGVTFSGGEPLLQSSNLVDCLKILKNEKIHVTIETSLFAPIEYLNYIKHYVDLWLVDIKIFQKNQCLDILNGNIKNFLNNFKAIQNNKIQLRFPLVYPHTYNKKNLKMLFQFISKNKIKKIEILKVHNFAENKYESLNLDFIRYQIKEDQINNLKTKLESDLGIEVKVLKI
ncbi:glycyl-radical enzyme activating protein [Methanobacterium formicicum]|uniref:Pyruvate formate-lyase 2 activating enzyme n=1 Tax=Methanobacterium formicicum (strain DSM 3637 / PP1) TaxID=1204725 RepID=K2QE61_METFP|nr:glycyl-radical enzyme activating protein [Methanobacterium formicicum]EKF86366.1 pyruvate formate-lyase 2 activating enzyme [Methanobacterium formicicum DSM 3637]